MIEDFTTKDKNPKRTPEELARLQKERILSSAKLVEEGADVTPEGKIVNVNQEGAEVEDVKYEIEERANIIKSHLEAAFENILDQEAGDWRVVAETINLGEGTDTNGPVKEIVIKKGETINVFVRDTDFSGKEMHPGITAIKVAYPEGTYTPGNASKWFYIPEKQLTGVQIKLDKPL